MKKIMLILLIMPFLQKVLAQDSTTMKLDELLTAYNSIGRFNGSALIARHDTILLQKGYGIKNAAVNSYNDENTRFQIASVTKQFTATVVLKMVELNKMSLGDKLSKYYSGFPNGDTITIEQMLTHTSGLHSFTETDSDVIETDEKRMVPYIRSFKPDFQPGTNWHYSNSNYVMLGYIIQKVSGLTYWQAVRKYIFTPLGMTSSGFDFKNLDKTERAVGYDVLNDSVKQPAGITDSTVPFGAGSIYSTVADMYKWHRGLQAYKVVGQALMEKAYTPCSKNNYGYGWQIDSLFGKKMVSHSGSITGFGSNFARIIKDDICIVLLSNKSGATFDVVHITNALMALLYNKPYTIPAKKVPVAVDTAVMKKYIGSYNVAEQNLVIDITLENGRLMGRPYHGPVATMMPLSEILFYVKEDEDTEIKFEMADGKVEGLTIIQPDKTRFAKKIK